MRLLDVHEFPPKAPEDIYKRRPYAILSHVWQEDELVFADLQNRDLEGKDYGKIIGAQGQAQRDGLQYVWIDTLCIDKSSSSELGEAINSMYKWYHQAAVCYVYLADLDGCPRLTDAVLRSGGTADERYWGVLFRESKWFKRGWTLQELIAPDRLRFYDKSWNFIGTLEDLAATVSETTNIHLSMLRHQNKPEDFSIAQRMSWAANRETTRPEDRAYSLLGVLDITISIRYGEGSQAFLRLQEAIIARDADQSVFAWEIPRVGDEDVQLKERRNSYLWYDHEWSQLLAPSPDAFAGARDIVPSMNASLPYRMTNLGLYITSDVPEHSEETIILNCHYKDDPTKAILLNIRHQETLRIRSEEAQGGLPPETIAHVFLRERSTDSRIRSRLSLMDVDQARLNAKPQTFYISRFFAPPDEEGPKNCQVWLQFLDEPDEGLRDMLPVVVSKLDFVAPTPRLRFESSNPPSDRNASNMTWTIEEDESATPSVKTVNATLRYDGTEHGTVELVFQLSNKRASICLTAFSSESQSDNTRSLVDTAKRGATKPVQTQVIPSTGFAVRASLRRLRFNGQDMYMIKVCSVRVKVPRWRLKRSWDWRRKMGLGGSSGKQC